MHSDILFSRQPDVTCRSTFDTEATVPVTPDKPVPYAPAKAILEIIGRYRTRGLQVPISAEVLGRSGISDSLIPRTLQALKTLDLIDAEERPTPTLDGLRLAPEAEYPARLRQWLKDAYADVLMFVDPATADETGLRDAFRSYTPIGQQDRMVSLFTGLCAAAGMGPEVVTKTARQRRSRPVSTPSGSSGKRASPHTGVTPLENDGAASAERPGKANPPHSDLIEQLIGKFPAFDPAWDDAIKTQWFKGFQQFMDMAKGRNDAD
jgi:hypothetical protein